MEISNSLPFFSPNLPVHCEGTDRYSDPPSSCSFLFSSVFIGLNKFKQLNIIFKHFAVLLDVVIKDA